ncbi:Na(+)/H(+) antiporter NhaA [Acrocarpospora phusangensis]|uniref:Na(+)/H(+) antiporter NhaA n=1 Tax=Acrocarpospora phusangensis TaxID=1070424 RepID=A0A919QGE4_9ACTN|nr:Na+/H+ antiporter NhaA [Acrocarpospora phusangensis]GIH25990.1 Na(+)/H(+) antiporter NhaA [Acrocarpospora phusangensis]
MPRAAEYWPLRPAVRYARQIAEALRAETVGGVIMLLATGFALIWANSAWTNGYLAIRDAVPGPFGMSLYDWSADGLLAVFFFVAGLEVRRELAYGQLSRLKHALLPVVSAVTGMAVPALIFVAVAWGSDGVGKGWAIPTATDIAFALAVLAVTASTLPDALRAFLLTLAVVDDLGAIIVIAVFYTEQLNYAPLLAAAVILLVYWLLMRADVRKPFVFVVLGVAAWLFVHESGVHPTVAGVLCGLLTSVRGDPSPAERADFHLRPISAGFCVPVFAFFAAGVPLTVRALGDVFVDRIAIAVMIALVLGKFLGVFCGAWLSVKLGFAGLSAELSWRDIAAVSVLAGIGFTVSLLIGDKAFPGDDRVTTAVLIASVIASGVAAALLRIRVRVRARDDV